MNDLESFLRGSGTDAEHGLLVRTLDRDRIRLLSGRRVKLVDLGRKHFPSVCAIARSDECVDSWLAHGAHTIEDRVIAWLLEDTIAQFAVVTRGKAGRTVGLLRCDSANFQHQTARISVLFDASVHRTGIVFESVGLFIDFLFATFPIRKIYAEMLEFNYARVASGAGRLFSVEGRLIDHEFHFGRTWDSYILAIDRKRWEDSLIGLVEKICRVSVASHGTA